MGNNKQKTNCKLFIFIQEICIQPSLVFGKTVQLSKGRGLEKRNWKRGWMGGKKPAHGSRQIVKRQGSCNSFAFIHRLIRLLKKAANDYKVVRYNSNKQASKTTGFH